MPKEVIMKCETNTRLDELSVQWGAADSVLLTVFHVNLHPAEAHDEPEPKTVVVGGKITELFGVDISGIDPELSVQLAEAVLAQDAITVLRGDRLGPDVPYEGPPPSDEEPAADPRYGEWQADTLWHLDRATINKLIRVLRNARDKAYGRDE